jgi:hypothetical protein
MPRLQRTRCGFSVHASLHCFILSIAHFIILVLIQFVIAHSVNSTIDGSQSAKIATERSARMWQFAIVPTNVNAQPTVSPAWAVTLVTPHTRLSVKEIKITKIIDEQLFQQISRNANWHLFTGRRRWAVSPER